VSTEVIDYYLSFRSHYCYLSIDRVIALEGQYPVTINLRPVYPLAIRTPEFFANIPRAGPNRWAYTQHDAVRIAERLSIPFGWPDPDPVVMDMTTFSISAEQPYIHRLTRLAVEACRQNQGLAFTRSVMRLLFGGTPGWDEGDKLAQAVASVGLDITAMEQRIRADPDDYDYEIAANEQSLNDAGHWGVPTLVFRDEAFFGQDRIEDLKWRIEQRGLTSA
jgi:2-hydroxychromene-2-carboxylate isomerase